MAENTGTPGSVQEEEQLMISDAVRAAAMVYREVAEFEAWNKYLSWQDRLVGEGALCTKGIINAFGNVKRWDFMPPQAQQHHGLDEPIPIGHKQTISQPKVVAQMLEWLKPKRGQRILDIGSGSGWTTTLLASIVGRSGQVIGVERIPELVQLGRDNLAKYDFPWTEIRQAGEELGVPEEAPFHRILVSAQLKKEWLENLVHQLCKKGGLMVAPLTTNDNYGANNFKDEMTVTTRNGEHHSTEIVARNYGFVPIVLDVTNSTQIDTGGKE